MKLVIDIKTFLAGMLFMTAGLVTMTGNNPVQFASEDHRMAFEIFTTIIGGIFVIVSADFKKLS